MFWENLTEEEGDLYMDIFRIAKPYIAWMNEKPAKRIGPCPPEPTNEQWIKMDRLSQKGWKENI